MHFTSLVVAAMAVAYTTATNIPNPFSPIPGYPWGYGNCLNDQQASFIVEQFRLILASPNRQTANTIAQTLIANNYVESSDSINILAGYPVGLSIRQRSIH